MTEEVVDVVGYKISDEKLQSLLPIIYWDDFEKYRDLPQDWAWNIDNGHVGYRDGWGYKFWCMSESGNTLLQVDMGCLFSEDQLPAYEILLKWLRDNYKHKKVLKEKEMFW